MKKHSKAKLVWDFIYHFGGSVIGIIFSILIYVACYYMVVNPFWGIKYFGIVLGIAAIFYVKTIVELFIMRFKTWHYIYDNWK